MFIYSPSTKKIEIYQLYESFLQFKSVYQYIQRTNHSFTPSFYSFKLIITLSEYFLKFLFKDSINMYLLHLFLICSLILTPELLIWKHLLATAAQWTDWITYEFQIYVIYPLYKCKKNLPFLRNSTYFQFCAVDFHDSKFVRTLVIWCNCLFKNKYQKRSA